MKTLYIACVLTAVVQYSVCISIQTSSFCSSTQCRCDTEALTVQCNGQQNITAKEFWVDSNNETYPFYKISIIGARFPKLSQFPNSSLKILNLSNNLIQEIDDEAFKYLQNLTELNLSDNMLTSELISPEIFKGLYAQDAYLPLKSLKVLNLANNLLHTLHSDFFEHVMNLEVLILEGNPLRVLDTQTVIAISGLMNLRELDLSNTYLKKIPDNIFHTPKQLEKLNLGSNLLQHIPTEQLEDARNLKYLSLNENPIKNITKDRGFPKLEKLKILHLCYMDELLEIEDESMSGLWNLEELHISNNKKLSKIGGLALRRVEGETPSWPQVTKLHLNNNALSTLSSSFLANWNLLTEVAISDNAWVCDCDTQWLLDTLVPLVAALHKNSSRAVRLHCAQPPEMRNQDMVQLAEAKEKLRCEDLYGGRPERDAGILIGILIGLLLGIPLVLGILFCYKRNFFGVFNSGPAAFSRKFYNPATMEEDFS